MVGLQLNVSVFAIKHYAIYVRILEFQSRSQPVFANTSKYFQNKPLFQKALVSSFSKIMNSIEGKGSVPDLLSSFCDRILKKGEKLNEAETENFLERVVKLFMYLQDKDMFGEIFRNQLAKRLLNEKSNSDELERSMIGKLKIACGAQFTAKLEGMMNDLAIGKDHQKKYDERKQREDLKHLPDFGVQILTTYHLSKNLSPRTFLVFMANPIIFFDFLVRVHSWYLWKIHFLNFRDFHYRVYINM